MKEGISKQEPGVKISIEKGLVGSLKYERFYFTQSQIEKLKNLNFPLDINEQTLITEIHLENSDSKLSEIRDAIRSITSGQEGYTIGVSWVAPLLKRFGFTVEEVSEDVIKVFPAGIFVKEQKRIADEFIAKIERLESRAATHTDNGIINTLNDEEMEELNHMRGTLVGYEKIMNEKGGKISYSDVKFAWMKNKN